MFWCGTGGGASLQQVESVLLDQSAPLTPSIVVELTGWPQAEADAWLDAQVAWGPRSHQW